ncbi:MAG: bifunctional methylenetetrahydrofolate dehydrogenase/methenyltetrahydrofolate cyclohydrolase FolD [Spirochaetaceae bacterium]|nr:MAG: bifunctional methylenetetrahydrofolate dehydrogenase/methenyltetrahydrofolate cyclohydrolase FolD [Spirochaetaceae bacterium]
MTGAIIDGTQIGEQIRAELHDRVAELVTQGFRPGLGVILVGDDPASAAYVRMKERRCADLGMHSDNTTLPSDASERDVIAAVDRLNRSPDVHGILVQMPLPAHIDSRRVIQAVAPDKDVDGLHTVNLGRLMAGEEGFVPCTPLGVLELLKRTDSNGLSGAEVVVVGRSALVGLPLANLLMQRGIDATVTVCHSKTRNLAEQTRRAQILIAAIGRAEFIRGDMVSDGTIVIDVGINRVDDPSKKRGYRIVGDVAYDDVAPKASAITPVPGGVGPMTIAMLLQNTVTACERITRSR